MDTTTIIAPGFYTARPVQWSVGPVGEKQTFAADVNFKIVGGAHDGKVIRYRGFLSEKAMARTLEHLKLCGFRDTNLKSFALGAEGHALNVDAEVRVSVKHEQYNGKTYTKIAGVYANQKRGERFMGQLPDIAAAMLSLGVTANAAAAQETFDDLPF